jgi:hypothetical protein
MPELNFAVEGAHAVAYCAVPTLAFKVRITTADQEPVRGVVLDSQIRIEATRRRYQASEKERLSDLFGEAERWGQTLRSLLWTHAHTNVPPFEGSVEIELPVPCTRDFDAVATKYFQGLETEAVVPLVLMFSGSVFFAGEGGGLQMERIPWSKEAAYELPVRVWKDVMDTYFPNTALLSLRQDVFDRLRQYKAQRGLPSWESVLEHLLSQPEEVPPR